MLAAVDDGPPDLAASVAMARAFVRAGTSRLVATPHVNRRWGFRHGEVEEAHRLLVEALSEEAIDLRIEIGAEVALSSAERLSDDDLAAVRLGGSDWLLIEPPAHGVPFAIHTMYLELLNRGFRVLIAHPERCDAFRREPDTLASLVGYGIRCQLTAGSLTGEFGRQAKDAAVDFTKRGLVHVVASDAHDPRHRPPGLDRQVRAAGFGHLNRWLTSEMPTWILDGGPEPPRPADPVRRGFLGRIRGNR